MMQTAEPGYQAVGSIASSECLLAFMHGIIDRLLVEVPMNDLHRPSCKLLLQLEDGRLKVGDLTLTLAHEQALVLQSYILVVFPLLKVFVVSLLN